MTRVIANIWRKRHTLCKGLPHIFLIAGPSWCHKTKFAAKGQLCAGGQLPTNTKPFPRSCREHFYGFLMCATSASQAGTTSFVLAGSLPEPQKQRCHFEQCLCHALSFQEAKLRRPSTGRTRLWKRQKKDCGSNVYRDHRSTGTHFAPKAPMSKPIRFVMAEALHQQKIVQNRCQSAQNRPKPLPNSTK